MKITDYSESLGLSDTDVILLDGGAGTRKIRKKAFEKTLMELHTYEPKIDIFDSYLHIYKRAGIVNIIYNGGISQMVSGEWITVFVLPEEYKPVMINRTSINNNNRLIAIEIESDGTVKAFNYGEAITENTNFGFNVTFMAASV